jgi:CRP-like cAMP-binding protein
MKAKRDVKVDHLRGIPLLAGCDDRALRRIASLADEIAVPSGYVLVHEGDWGREVFIIEDGVAEVAVDGRQQAVLGPGSFVGKMAVLDQGRRSASVAAVTPLRLLVLESRAFLAVLEDNPSISRRLMAGLSHRLRAAQGFAT